MTNGLLVLIIGTFSVEVDHDKERFQSVLKQKKFSTVSELTGETSVWMTSSVESTLHHDGPSPRADYLPDHDTVADN